MEDSFPAELNKKNYKKSDVIKVLEDAKMRHFL